MKSLGFAVACVLLLGFASGCGPNGQDQAAAPTKIIGASLLTQSHVFYQDLVGALKAEAENHGFKLLIQYCEFDGAKQNDQLQTFVRQKVHAIVVSPQDSGAIAPAIAEAQGDGIPVFTVDIAAHNVAVLSHIASDNVQGGRLIGEYLAKLLDGKGRVAIVDHPETASVQERVRGFEEAIAQYPELAIVRKVPGGGQRDKAFRATRDLLEAQPDLNAIFPAAIPFAAQNTTIHRAPLPQKEAALPSLLW